MSNNFNSEVNEAKINIQNQCKIYKENYELFNRFFKKIKYTDKIDEHTKDQCKNLIVDLNEGNIKMIFCGQVKSGKSRCIMEFLSGKVNLPSRSTPTTSFFSHIFYSKEPTLYSETANNEIIKFEFDGKTVKEKYVGRTDLMPDSKIDLRTIYHIGTPYTFNDENFHIIDTPGLNETKELTDTFFINVKRFNPQLIVYIYDAGPKFTVTDETFCTTLIAESRKRLKKIFLFNKYDNAFIREKTFESSDSDSDTDENKSDDDSYDTDDGDSNDDEGKVDLNKEKDNLELYKKDYEIHYNSIKEKLCHEHIIVLFGYSSRLVQSWRIKKENQLPFLLWKHVDFFTEIKNQINLINLETINELFEFCKLYLYTVFKSVYGQIIFTRDTNLRGVKIRSVGKAKILSKFNETHEKIKLNPQNQNKFELKSTIDEIIKNQEKQIKDVLINIKLRKITKSLINFLINRYTNLFSNIIQENLDRISFESFCNEIKINELERYFPHTFCTLKQENDTYNLNSVIEKHFDDQLKQHFLEKNYEELQSIENYRQYVKDHLKYDIEDILPEIEDYLKIKLDKERKYLIDAIDKKTNEIVSSYKQTKQDTEVEIKKIMEDFKMWLFLNNNFIKLIKEKSKIFDLIEKFNGSNKNVIIDDKMIIKREKFQFDKVTSKNFVIIQYFLRSQFISNDLLEHFTFYCENKNELYFITKLDEFQPLRMIFQKINETNQIPLISKLLEIIEKLIDADIPLDNFGLDMIFCVLNSTGDIEIKLSETIQEFYKWKFTLENGELCNDIFFKYPHSDQIISIGEKKLSMVYSFAWIVLMILYGKYENILEKNILSYKNYKAELDKKYNFNTTNSKTSKIYENCKRIIDFGLKRPFDPDNVRRVSKLLIELSNEFNG